MKSLLRRGRRRPPIRRAGHCLLWVMSALAVTVGCGASDSAFNRQHARAHVERLAGGIGSRAAGTSASQLARAYLIETLQLYGFDVRVQETEAHWREGGRTTRVANIIAIRPGQSRDAIGLVAHYDSVTAGPGAGDDAFGVAVALEAARVLAARTSPRYSLMVLLTDGEEDGLMGARAIVQDAEVRARLRTFINLEAIGTREPVPLFEIGPGMGPALQAWAAAPHPRGGSYMLSIYKALPNDTDATVLRELNVFGLNFAAVGDSHAYHTDRDRADRVTPGALGNIGDNVVAIVQRLDEAALDGTADTPIYFSVLDRRAFILSTTAARTLAVGAALLGLLSWFGLTRQALHTHGVGSVVITYAWATVATGAVAVALWGAVWLLRSARVELHPWHASPWRLFAFMTIMVVATTWVIRRAAAALPLRLRPLGTPGAVWMTALPVWIAATVASLLYAISASYLVAVPLALTALLLPLGFVRQGFARVVSGVSVLVVWTLWLPDVWALMTFSVAVLARLPIVTPTWLYPALFLVIGAFLWPPVLAVLVGRPAWRLRHGLAASVLMVVVVVAAALVLLAPAYTAEQPQRRAAIFVDDRTTGHAFWRVAGNEPGVDIGNGPANVQWRLLPPEARAEPWSPPGAFVFEGRVAPGTAEPPARVTSLVTRHDTGADIEVTVAAHPHERLTAVFVLPEAVVPTSTTWPGRTVGGRWRATYTNVPREGITWRATVPASQADALAELNVWLRRPGVPDGEPKTGLPAWLSTERTAWTASTITMLGVTPNESVVPEASDMGVSSFAPTPLGRVHYLDRGTGNTAIVFLHGWGGHAEFWRDQLPLAAGHRVLFVDLPGHGRSDVGAGPYTVAAMAEAVHLTLQAAGVTRAVVVGHSLGALVGWHVALRAPDRVEGFISVDGTLLPFLPTAEDATRFKAGIDPGDMRPFIDGLVPGLFTPATPPQVRATVIPQIQQTAPPVLASFMTDVAVVTGPPFAPGTLQRPTLVLASTGPDTPPTHEAQVRSAFPSLDYRALPGTGHYLMMERAREVNDAIAGFLLGRGLLR